MLIAIVWIIERRTIENKSTSCLDEMQKNFAGSSEKTNETKNENDRHINDGDVTTTSHA